ncbi:MAG: DUF2576 domain-containing protein, partial [Cyanobacteriota bacterium]|nr:DUF2576 domain-containing protein [Cyanobacteriota bacterium]
TILSEGKSACFPRVDQKMRQTNKLYRGVSSICTREGKTFKCFKDFVKAAAKDGKICVKHKEKSGELVLARC